MEKKKLNIKVKIAVGIIIFIVALFIGSFVYYKQGIKATSSKNKEVIVTIPKGSSGNDIIKILDKNSNRLCNCTSNFSFRKFCVLS